MGMAMFLDDTGESEDAPEDSLQWWDSRLEQTPLQPLQNSIPDL